jgi:hypothetical protein
VGDCGITENTGKPAARIAALPCLFPGQGEGSGKEGNPDFLLRKIAEAGSALKIQGKTLIILIEIIPTIEYSRFRMILSCELIKESRRNGISTNASINIQKIKNIIRKAIMEKYKISYSATQYVISIT